jgi:homoserine O-acetyltransferase
MQGLTQLVKLFNARHPFQFECGASLDRVNVAYETHGDLNAGGDNVILICHALTGEAHIAGKAKYSTEVLKETPVLNSMQENQLGWWDGMIGPGKAFDTEHYFVICSNILGSCYGTSGPTNLNPHSKESFRSSFPQMTVRDMVNLQFSLLTHLGIKRIVLITGGSLGGMQALEWAIMYPQMVKSIVPIATSVQHSAWCISLNHLAREAIVNDPTWNGGNYLAQPEFGLSLARKIAMVSYRSDVNYNQRFARDRLQNNDHMFDDKNLFQVESYLNYQGQKLVRRFDANSYLYISRAMDAHDISRDRSNLMDVLASIKARTLCIGIDSD